MELDIDIGADAKDWNAIQAGEKLKPVEMELRRIEEVTAEIVKEMEYLREREMSLRDTNESTNERVKWFAIGTMGILVGFGAWQVIYLRAYFRLVMMSSIFEVMCFTDNLKVQASHLRNWHADQRRSRRVGSLYRFCVEYKDNDLQRLPWYGIVIVFIGGAVGGPR